MLITCALDKQLRVFDVSKRAFIASLEVGGAGIACLLTEAAYFMVRWRPPLCDILVARQTAPSHPSAPCLTEVVCFDGSPPLQPSIDILVGSLDGNVYCVTLKSEW